MPRVLTTLLLLGTGLLLGAAPRPEELPAYRQGIEALSSRLWEIAAKRFREALESKDLDQPARIAILLRLAEAQTRGDEGEAALATLAKPELAALSAARFWQGQALADLGRFREAAEKLAAPAEDPRSPFHTEAAFTRAGLLLAIGDSTAAKATLEVLAKGQRADEARLRLAEIAFDQGDNKEARRLLGQIQSRAPGAKRQAEWLDARLLLEEGKPAEAAAKFRALIENPEGQSLVAHHSAFLGLADALAAAGANAEATDTLVQFIPSHPRSPILEAAFRRLRALLPENPSPTDPILEIMAKWAPASSLPVAPVPIDPEHLSSVWPAGGSGENPDLAAPALYHRAHGLHQIDSPASKAQALQLLRRLRLEFPAHPLARRALLDLGRWLLEDNKPAEATAALASLEGLAVEPRIKATAAFLAAKSAFLAGRFEEAAELFTQAAGSFDTLSAEAAAIDAGVARILAGQSTPPAPARLAKVRTELQLERALFLAGQRKPEARPLLDTFLLDHPEHPRAAEARLALARIALAPESPDPALAEAQLDAIAQLDPLPVPPSDFVLARLQLRQAQEQWPDVAAIAQDFLARFPEDPAVPDVTLQLGTAQFRQGDFHQARITLAKLAESDKSPSRASAARFLAARAAALGATVQARAESLALYDQVISAGGPLADAAKLEKARTLIDLTRFDEAVALLRPLFRGFDRHAPLQMPAGALLGEALFAMGGNRPDAYREALSLYESLAAAAPKNGAWHHRFQYLRGLTLEQLQRTGDALDTYYSVLQSAKDRPPADWEWLERSGFRALALLEGAERWEAAAALASTIASFQGPRAKEAAARAHKLRLEHMIWDP